MVKLIYRNLEYAKTTLPEPGHCSECRDSLKQGEEAFRALDTFAAPKLCVHCAENLVKMAEFREEFHKRLQKSGWFNEDDP